MAERITAPITPEASRDAIRVLQRALLELLRASAFPDYPVEELTRALSVEARGADYGDVTSKLVAVSQDMAGLKATGWVDDATASHLTLLLEEYGLLDKEPDPDPVDVTRAPAARVAGAVVTASGIPLPRLKLRLARRGFGGAADTMANAESDDGGRFVFEVPSLASRTSVDVRIGPEADERIISGALTLAVGSAREGLLLVVPEDVVAPAPEFERLIAAIGPLVSDATPLSSAREDADRDDLTVLADSTGWDARLVALAAVAARMGEDQHVPLAPAEAYALLRSGLPSDLAELSSVPPEQIERALRIANERGIAQVDEKRSAEIVAAFPTFAATRRLDARPLGAPSSFAELLDASGVSAKTRRAFAPLALDASADELWDRAKEAGIPESDVRKLKLNGALSFLTDGSAPLVQSLTEQLDGETQQLVDLGANDASFWVERIGRAASVSLDTAPDDAARARLAAIVPPRYGTEDPAAGARLWAAQMASRVRSAAPTRSLAARIGSDEKYTLGAASIATTQLLNGLGDAGFRIGETALSPFLAAHPELTANADGPVLEAAVDGVKRVHRLTRLCTDEESVAVLLQLGIDSADDIVRVPEHRFVGVFQETSVAIHGISKVIDIAHLIYARARQVSAVTYSVFTSASTVVAQPPVAGLAAPAAHTAGASASIIARYPTLEVLLGSTDYVHVPHSGSVLGPAAYLADLLQFLDMDGIEWAAYVAEWSRTHGGEPYPHRRPDGTAFTPYDALDARRPDISRLELGADNTERVLPYVDVALEVLETVMTEGKVTATATHDSPAEGELLAEPRHVNRTAYAPLVDLRFPAAVPFDLDLELAREHLRLAGASLPDLARVLHPESGPGAVEVAAEELGIAPGLLGILSDADPLSTWPSLFGETDAAAALAALIHVKTLVRRLDIDYTALVALLRIPFVNTGAAAVGVLRRLGVGVRDAQDWLSDRALAAVDPATLDADGRRRRLDAIAFSERITKLGTESGTAEADIVAAIEAIPYEDTLVLADTNPGASLDDSVLRRADGSPATGADVLRIAIAVRLLRALEVDAVGLDRILRALLPGTEPYGHAETDHSTRPLRALIRRVAAYRRVVSALGVRGRAAQDLLVLWAPIDTQGHESDYARLFLRSRVGVDAAYFDDALGNPPGGTSTVGERLTSLAAALGIDAPTLADMLIEADISTTDPLDLTVISALRRRSVLAAALRIRTGELAALTRATGLDPFPPVSAAPEPDESVPEPIETGTLALVSAALVLRRAGIRPLEFANWTRGIPEGSEPSERALVAAVGDAIDAVLAELDVPGGDASIDEAVLWQRVAQVLPSDVADRLQAVVAGTAEFTAEVATATPLADDTLAGIEEVRALSYDAVRGVQRLTVRGIVAAARADEIAASRPLPPAGQPFTPSPLLRALLDEVLTQPAKLLEGYAQSAVVPGTTGLFTPGDLATLLAADPTDPARIEAVRRARMGVVTARLLPVHRAQRVRDAIQTALVAAMGAPADTVRQLTTGPQAPTVNGASVHASLELVAAPGLSARFTGGGEDAAVVLADSSTQARGADGTPARPAGSDACVFEGSFRAPKTGAHRLELVLSGGAGTLELPDLVPPVTILVGPHTPDAGMVVDLVAGARYRLRVSVSGLNADGAQVFLTADGVPRQTLSGFRLRQADRAAAATTAVRALRSWTTLAERTGLVGDELAVVLSETPDAEGFTALASAPATDDATERAATAARGRWVLDLARRALLRSKVPGGSDSLLALARALSRPEPDRRAHLMALLTDRWELPADLANEALDAVPLTPPLDPGALQRLLSVTELSDRIGRLPADLSGWLDLLVPGTTASRRAELAEQVRAAARSQTTAEQWPTRVRPAADALRRRRRDVLVAVLLHRLGLDRMEQLYELLLLDPGMEPVVETSRIRLAIASVQLFVQRCLLGMELQVEPSAIDAERWEWMKRYRVWEANRKIFLYPENWLAPELRDDASYLFDELQGALLQNDVDADVAEEAFLAYLRHLEPLGRVEIVSMHLENRFRAADRTLHVLGRTYSSPHEYVIRTYRSGAWSPWEQVTAEIEGDHVVPVVWRGRLGIFWLTFMERQNMSQTSVPAGKLTEIALTDVVGQLKNSVAKRDFDVRLNWSEKVGGAWTPRTTDTGHAVMSFSVTSGSTPADFLVHTSTETGTGGRDGALLVHVEAPGSGGRKSFRIPSRTAPPQIIDTPLDAKAKQTVAASGVRATRYTGTGSFQVSYRETVQSGTENPSVNRTVLGAVDAFSAVPTSNRLTAIGVPDEAWQGAQKPNEVRTTIERGFAEVAALIRPVVYQDSERTVFVETEVTETTIENWNTWIPDFTLGVDTSKNYADGILAAAAAGAGKLDLIEKDFSLSRIVPEDPIDWLQDERTLVAFDGALIGRHGRTGVSLVADAASASVLNGLAAVGVDGAQLVITDPVALAASGVVMTGPDSATVAVIGARGLAPATAALLGERRDLTRGASPSVHVHH